MSTRFREELRFTAFRSLTAQLRQNNLITAAEETAILGRISQLHEKTIATDYSSEAKVKSVKAA